MKRWGMTLKGNEDWKFDNFCDEVRYVVP